MVVFSFAAPAPNGEKYVDSVFFDNFDKKEVNSAKWHVATWKEHGGQTGKDRCFVKNGFLHLQFTNSSTDGYLSSAIQTREEFFYGKWEMRAKPSSVPGVLNSFYTIDWDNTGTNSSTSDGTKQEIDIELLTKSFKETSGEIHLAIHEQGKESWDTRPDIKLWFNPSDNFHVYGFNITPEFTEWFVDDTIINCYEYDNNFIKINSPYQLKLNSWSAQKWIEGPPETDVICDYQIDWIKFTPYDNSPVRKQNAEKNTTGNILTVQRNKIVFSRKFESIESFRLFDICGRMILKKNSFTKKNQKNVIDLNSVINCSGFHIYSLDTETETISAGVMLLNQK